MSDCDESFELHRDIKPYSFEPLAKKVKSDNGTLDIDTEAEQPPVPPTPAPVPGPQELPDWCVFTKLI
jgi:hypothetical protein